MGDFLIFECPRCHIQTSIDCVYNNVIFRETFDMADDGTAEYTETEVIDYGEDYHYACSNCRHILPCASDEELHAWLVRRPENVGKVMEEL